MAIDQSRIMMQGSDCKLGKQLFDVLYRRQILDMDEKPAFAKTVLVVRESELQTIVSLLFDRRFRD